MSFWSSLIIHPDSNAESIVELENQTYNHNRIWYNAIGHTFSYFRDKQAKELILPLKLGLARITCDPDYYDKLKPKNGWGNLNQAVEYMIRVLNACIEFPEAYYRFNG